MQHTIHNALRIKFILFVLSICFWIIEKVQLKSFSHRQWTFSRLLSIHRCSLASIINKHCHRRLTLLPNELFPLSLFQHTNNFYIYNWTNGIQTWYQIVWNLHLDILIIGLIWQPIIMQLYSIASCFCFF